VALGIWDFTAEAFAQCIGQIFEMHPPEGEAIRLELIKAVSFGHRPPLIPGIPQRQDSFSLLFRSADGRVLEPGLYRMIHPGFEALDLHGERTQPPSEDPQGVYYEAVFN
jgi:uncharacterized protein DUF6916